MPHGHALTRPALLALVCLLGLGVAARAQETPSPTPFAVPSPTGKVNDYANVIEPLTEARIERMLRNLDRAQQIEFGVLTVKSLGGADIFDASLAVMRGWGIGTREKPGLLLMVSADDRKYFVQTSRHVEGDLPDSLTGQLLRENFVPRMQQGDTSGAFLATTQAFVRTLAEKRGFSLEGIDTGPTQPRRPVREPRAVRRGGFSFCGIAFVLLIVFILIMASGRRGGGGGCLNLLLLNALFNAGRGGGSGWGGGGFGTWGGGGGGGGSGWGGGDGGFGGFSGGGGDAGGGGAGGSW
jgi:uncharacterized protein